MGVLRLRCEVSVEYFVYMTVAKKEIKFWSSNPGRLKPLMNLDVVKAFINQFMLDTGQKVKKNIRTRIPGVEPGAVERAVNCWNS